MKYVRSLGMLGVCASLVLGACGGGGSSNDAPVAETGRVTVSLTDAPVDSASEVWVRVTGVAFKPLGEAPERVQNFAPRTINLLQYRRGLAALLLEDVEFEAGRYQWLRLLVASEPNVRDSYVVVNGAECELRIPSGAESGLKVARGFSIPANGSLALTVDFDLRRSLRAPPGFTSGTTGACTQGYVLRPVLRLIHHTDMGAAAGTVSFAAQSVPVGCLPKVYLFEGSVTPDDMNDPASATDIEPVTVADVDIPSGAFSGTWHAAFLPSGPYTAAFTCSEDTDADETLVFEPAAGVPVTVQHNLISTVNFAVPVPPAPPSP
jgi:hypothetical protein